MHCSCSSTHKTKMSTLLILLIPSRLFHLRLLLLFATVTVPAASTAGNGSQWQQWQLLQESTGVVAMHVQLLHNDRVIMYDRTDFGYSNISLPVGKCRHDPIIRKDDCTAHSIEYDVANNTIRPLFLETDVWCSSGSAVADGTLVQTGGFNEGERTVRTFQPCPTCDWKDIDGGLLVKRWYATNHILPDGRQIIIGGRYQFNYEFYPKEPSEIHTYILPFLLETYDKGQENNLYPFVFLNVDGNLFIFANNRAILFNYKNNTVLRTYPEIPGGEPRCYPSTGSAVLLPLRNKSATLEAEVLICGGAPKGAYLQASPKRRTFLPALNTCARMKITDPNPIWVMETMPCGRLMSDMLLLPNGDVLIINGAALGSAAWDQAVNPVYEPFVYKTNGPVGNRFEVQAPSQIARMYHSTAILLRDGRVLVGGGNAHDHYRFNSTEVFYPTELRLEAFSPQYLDPTFSPLRPTIVFPASQTNVTYGQRFKMRIKVDGKVEADLVSVTMYAPSFTTHSFSMNQRLLVLPTGELRNSGRLSYEFVVTAPRSSVLAPPGYYILFAVHRDIPSEGIWINIQ